MQKHSSKTYNVGVVVVYFPKSPKKRNVKFSGLAHKSATQMHVCAILLTMSIKVTADTRDLTVEFF